MYPQSFPTHHHMFLTITHAAAKYVRRPYEPGEVAIGWRRARIALRGEDIALHSESELCSYCGDHALGASNPLLKHPLFSI
jgi:hypothetical protein